MRLGSKGTEGKMGLVLKDKLKSLCCSNGWCYGLFWRFNQRNSMFLTVEDAYCDEQMEAVLNRMRPQAHMLGEGIVGQVASTGKHQWISANSNGGEWNSAGSIGSQDIFQDDFEISQQFSSGIQTIAVISVESQGVMQFGSTQKILEEQEFLDQTKRLFMEMENINGLTLTENPLSSLNCESYDLNEWFDSLSNGNITPIHGGICNELMEIAFTSISATQSFSLTSDVQQEGISPLCLDSSHSPDQLQTAGIEAQVILPGNPITQFQRASSQSLSSTHKSAIETSCISTWSSANSIVTSLRSEFPSEKRVLDSSNAFSTIANTSVSCSNTKYNFPRDSTFTSFYSAGVVDAGKSIQENPGKSISNQHSAPSMHATKGELLERGTGLHGFPEKLKPDDFATDLFSPCVMDNIFEWFSPSPQHSMNGIATTTNESLSQSRGVTSVCSGLIGDLFNGIPIKQSANSVQSSVTDAYVCSRKQKSAFVNGAEKDLFESLGGELGRGQAGDCWEDIMMPAVSGGGKAISTGVSECISELDVGSMTAPRKGLFSELGLGELIDGISNSKSVTKSSIDDHLSMTKRRKIENSSVSYNQVQLGNLSSTSSSMRMHNEYNLDKMNSLLLKKEVFPKSQVALFIDDSHSVNNGNAALTKPKKPEEPAKATRKRARPGESTRPRPKDRQQIHDRIQELRGIIPDGGKCSIDALLDRTIKHMLFLQSVTKYADKLKQADEPKLIGQENRMFQKDNNTSTGGITWALEVADQTTVCPIIVEDLNPPGLMLIEMLCEDRGFFLEIADVIKGFGLNILKGRMETREDKIWARFIVEAKVQITRIEIFWSLAQLLERTGISGMDSMNQPSNAMNVGIPLLSNYKQPALPCPVSLTETLQ